MIIKPQLESHTFQERQGPSRLKLTYITGTIFEDLELQADWDKRVGAYQIRTIKLSFRPAAVQNNRYAPWAKVEDRRYKTKTKSYAFREFCETIKEALDCVNKLKELIDNTPAQTVIEHALSNNLRMTSEGLFLIDWLWAPIFDGDPLSHKAAALAVVELLQIEAQLPREEL